jgi:serine/threonine protein kinase
VLGGFGAINAKRLLREICILRNLDHPNIMNFRGLIAPVDINNLRDLYIVSDYVVTDLHKILHSDQPLTGKHVQYIIYQMIKAVRFLHEREIYHRDIKPANLLIDERVSLKLCDFGLSRSTSVQPRLKDLIAHAQAEMASSMHDEDDAPHAPQPNPKPHPSPSAAPARRRRSCARPRASTGCTRTRPRTSPRDPWPVPR